MLKNVWFYISLILIATLSFFVYKYFHPNQIITYVKKEGSTTKTLNCQYKYINPGRCEPDLAVKKKEYVELQTELRTYIEGEIQKNHLTIAAIYFRDLENGPTMNINGNEIYAPASLLKVPLMITFLKLAETDSSLMDKKILVPASIKPMMQNIQPDKQAVPGSVYTMTELLDFLITQSDNNSWLTLLQYLRKNYSEETFIDTLSDLGIVDPRDDADQQDITVQAYAAIFRILYNSSYLSIPSSDKALEILSRSVFKKGLVAGVPGDTKVAHKFGEQLNGAEQQLHDCGIVYYPKNPYILCIMTRGHAIDELESIIGTISKKVYEEVVKRD